MSKLRSAIIAALAVFYGVPASAADFADPTWPCVRRKVESLSLGLMWSHPMPEGNLRTALDPQAAELVETLVLRRVPLEQAEALIAGFASATPDLTADNLGQIFRGVFVRIDRDRSQLIAGISRYSLTQIDVAARIDAMRVEMDEIMAQDAPDFDRVDALEEKLDWDQRIYHDRVQSLTYVCETPVLLEKRAYAIAQMLVQHLPD